jgi:hypothetical protein
MPKVNWQRYFPVFKDEKGDDVALHLIKFDMHACKLKVQCHEDYLMNMFMASLEGKARSWCEQLPDASLYYLRDFHMVLFEHFKESCPLSLLVENFCEYFENCIQNLEHVYEDGVFMDDEIIEVWHGNPFQHLYIQESVQETYVSLPAKNEEINNPIVEFHIPSPELHENFPQSYQMSCNSEEVQDSQIGLSSCLSISESLCQEGSSFLDSFDNHNHTSFEENVGNQILHSEISKSQQSDISKSNCLTTIKLYEESNLHDSVVDSFECCHDNSIHVLNMKDIRDEYTVHSSYENQFDSLQMEPQFEQPCYSNQMLEYIKDYHVFLDSVADYVEEFFNWDSGSYFHFKEKICCQWLLEKHFFVLILIKHDQEILFLDQLLDWLYWHFCII